MMLGMRYDVVYIAECIATPLGPIDDRRSWPRQRTLKMGDEIGVELDDIAADVDYKPSEKESKRANKETKVRYESILTDWFDDKKNWWDAVEDSRMVYYSTSQ